MLLEMGFNWFIVVSLAACVETFDVLYVDVNWYKSGLFEKE